MAKAIAKRSQLAAGGGGPCMAMIVGLGGLLSRGDCPWRDRYRQSAGLALWLSVPHGIQCLYSVRIIAASE